MRESARDPPKKTDRARAYHTRLSLGQVSIELHAMELRAQLGLDEFCNLSQEQALRLIPDCEIHAVKNVHGILFETLLEFHTDGRHIGAFAVKIGRSVHIVFNDAYPVTDVRVHMMEEFFHLRLGHPPDTVRLYAMDGRFRTYNQQNEDEAYGSALAALVPFAGLQDMLARGTHICRIAEHFVVPISVVQERIAATNLGHLASTSAQLRLLA
jgi:hypothetical protein